MEKYESYVSVVDCNNFFVSCERVFRPDLYNKPVVVLSNNDGCIIARSNESKALGIKMGEPLFKVRDILERNNVVIFSSNLALYCDMSWRVMSLLQGFAPDVEIYSIDEAFLSFKGFKRDNLANYGKTIINTVTKSTGIPVSIGIAPTKTLAKIASRFAKKYAGYEGVCIIDTDEKRIKALQNLEIGDVWGVGHGYQRKLEYYGVKTAYDLTLKSESWIRRMMTVVGVRTWKELLGIPIIDLETTPAHKQTICTSRSFGEMIEDFDTLMEAVANFAASCSRKLRQQHSCAGILQVFITTNRFREDLPQYYQNRILNLPTPSNDVSEIIHYARIALKSIYRLGYAFNKAGVIVADIIPENCVQLNVFDTRNRAKHQKILSVLDSINHKYGDRLLKIASQGSAKKWQMKSEYLSKQYTTNPADFILVANK